MGRRCETRKSGPPKGVFVDRGAGTREMRGMVQRSLCAGRGKRDFSHPQADAFVPQNRPGRKRRVGANAEEKVGLLRSK